MNHWSFVNINSQIINCLTLYDRVADFSPACKCYGITHVIALSSLSKVLNLQCFSTAKKFWECEWVPQIISRKQQQHYNFQEDIKFKKIYGELQQKKNIQFCVSHKQDNKVQQYRGDLIKPPLSKPKTASIRDGLISEVISTCI